MTLVHAILLLPNHGSPIFSRNGFEIVAWEPPTGVGGCTGEFSIRWNRGPVILVEVKSPDWQGELTESEKRSTRKQLGKYVDAEARSVDPFAQPSYVIRERAVPKFTGKQPTLVVVADDQFISPVMSPHPGGRIDALLAEPGNCVLGGVLFFNASPYQSEIEYTIHFHANSWALGSCQIPIDVAEGLTISSQQDELKHRRRYRGPQCPFLARTAA
jgi:hypothetical protein